MTQPAPSASSEHLDKIVKGLRACVPESRLQAALQRNQLLAPTRAQRIPLAAIRTLVTELAKEQQEPWLLVRAFSYLNYTEAFLATTYLGNARTLRDAINLSKRYFHQNSDLASLALELNGNQASIVVTPTAEAQATDQQLLAALYAVMRTCQGLGLQQASAGIAGMSDDTRDACRRLLRLPVAVLSGEQRLELQFPAMELARALNTTQPNIARLARRERQLIRTNADHCWSESVQLLLTALLPRGETRISRCASLLAVAPRTLQRKLAAEQQPFSALLATVRQRLCLEYVQADHADDTLALLLGYRQTSQFYRQFRLWFGCSPGQLRSRLTPEIAKTTKTRGRIHAPPHPASRPTPAPCASYQRR
ncbi:helix-turn-helix domain-containing protein [Halopseudomonas maritima]|uniref:helix-turn-helix domain-containing protein n=1 Tax=Halopseudomonas maritima TaxID=2918528 RepID=UPI001EEBC7F3|nr:helix-turn-helix domain-containing protein [Halopseudomonas maritima]UJJ31812.1 helix-turn-helix domain-containing protein [Halopseudomonas maritima]